MPGSIIHGQWPGKLALIIIHIHDPDSGRHKVNVITCQSLTWLKCTVPTKSLASLNIESEIEEIIETFNVGTELKIAQPRHCINERNSSRCCDLIFFQRALCQQQRAGGWHLRPQVLSVPPGAVCQGRHHGHRPHMIIIALYEGSSFQRRPNSTAGLVPPVLAFPI